MNGIVKSFNSKRGYGFITGEDGKEYFVHYSNIKMDGFKTLHKNQEVMFEVISSEKGEIAVNVKVIK